MAKRTQPPTRPRSRTASAPSSINTPGALEQRVLAFAEQLGRIAGTVQARTAGWMEGDTLKNDLAGVRDGAADLVHQLTGNAPIAPKRKGAKAGTARKAQGRSGGVVDAPGKRHRPRLPADPDARRAGSQAAKMRGAKTMAKTPRHRGRG